MKNELEIHQVAIAVLKPASYNPRSLSDEEEQQLKVSLDRFGFVSPVIVNMAEGRENTIVGGHQRVTVALSMGIETVPCVFVDLDEQEEKELSIRLNRNNGHWDQNALFDNFEKTDLKNWGFDNSELKFFDDVSAFGGDDPDEEGVPVLDQDGQKAKVGGGEGAEGANDPDEDGEESEGEGSGESDRLLKTTAILWVKVGPYRFKIAKDEFNRWEKGLQDKLGYEHKSIVEWLTKQLALTPCMNKEDATVIWHRDPLETN